MQPINPTKSNLNSFQQVLRNLQSFYQCLVGNIAFVSPVGTNASGVYNKFVTDNGDGVMIRIGAYGSGEAITWPATPGALAINHGLQRQPIGFIVVDTDTPSWIFQSSYPPTKDTITLSCQVTSGSPLVSTLSNAVNATVYIF